MPVKVTCHSCGKVFSKPPKEAKKVKDFHFCSKSCHDDWQRLIGAKICQSCGKSFNGPGKKYCSLECSQRVSKGGRITKPCKFCQKHFTVWRFEARERQFCSRKCAYAARYKPKAPNPQKPIVEGKKLRKPAVYINCKGCGKEFRIYPSRQGATVFCSRKCQREYEASKLITKICPECNKPFEVIPARQYFVFCSQQCYIAKMSRGGEDNPHWKGGCAHYYGPNWQQQRRKALKRDDYTCQVCGLHQDNHFRELDVHHKKRFQEFGLENYKQANRLSNLITLCPTCHHKAESGRIPLPIKTKRTGPNQGYSPEITIS